MSDDFSNSEPQEAQPLPPKKWYVVRVFSGHEKQVQKTLKERVRNHPLGHCFGQILVPTEEVVEMRGGSKKTSERKFFPGYMLIEASMTEDTWHLIRSVPKLGGFVGGSSTQPTPLSDDEARRIKAQVEEGNNEPRPKFTFKLGEMVRVTDGPFADFSGTVDDVNAEKSRLWVSVTIFGRSTPIELEFGQVEKT